MKGFGYLISTFSVALLGIAAWPRPDEPKWKTIVILLGMAASVLGMALRYISHLREKREVDQVSTHKRRTA